MLSLVHTDDQFTDSEYDVGGYAERKGGVVKR